MIAPIRNGYLVTEKICDPVTNPILIGSNMSLKIFAGSKIYEKYSTGSQKVPLSHVYDFFFLVDQGTLNSWFTRRFCSEDHRGTYFFSISHQVRPNFCIFTGILDLFSPGQEILRFLPLFFSPDPGLTGQWLRVSLCHFIQNNKWTSWNSIQKYLISIFWFFKKNIKAKGRSKCHTILANKKKSLRISSIHHPQCTCNYQNIKLFIFFKNRLISIYLVLLSLQNIKWIIK